MKKEMLVFTALFICAVLTFSAASVHAEAVSTSRARIYWISLDIPEENITWLAKISGSSAYAEDVTSGDVDFHTHTEPEWVYTTASASIPSSDPYVFCDAYTDDDYLCEDVYADANEAITLGVGAVASAYRRGEFIANSSGSVTLSADYELSQDLWTDNAGESAYGFAEAGLWLMNQNTNDEVRHAAELDNSVSDGQFISDLNDVGTLTVALWFDAGQYGLFDLRVYNEAHAEIPEPATIALLVLGALSLLRRKRVG